MKVKEFWKFFKVYRSKNLIENPLISIIMPTYCRGDNGLLERSINTILNQTFKLWELIIVDDGSIDSTQNIIKKYLNLDNRIVYIRNEINSGLPAIRVNQGIKYARGLYISYQFDDDQWCNDMLEIMYNQIKTKNTLSFVYGKCKVKNTITSQEWIIGSNFTSESLNKSNCIPNNSILYSKEIPYLYGALECHIGCVRYNDWNCWIRWSKHIDFSFIDKVVSTVEICNKDSLGIIYPDDREIFRLLNFMNRREILKIDNIGECEIDNLDFITDPTIKKKFLNDVILPWQEKFKS